VAGVSGAGEAETPRNPALQQIQRRGYADKYLGQAGKRVWELGIVFDAQERNLAAFDWAERTPPLGTGNLNGNNLST